MRKKVEDGVRPVGVPFDPNKIDPAIAPYYTPWEQYRPRDGSWGYAIIQSGELASQVHVHACDTFIFIGGKLVAVEKTGFGHGGRTINAAEVIEEDILQNAENGAIVDQLEECLKDIDQSGFVVTDTSRQGKSFVALLRSVRLLLQLEIRMHRASNPHDLDTILGKLAEADTQAHDIAAMVAHRAKVKELLDDLDQRIATRVEEYVEGWER